MSADADYARIVEMLSKQHLSAFVAYDSLDRVNGLGNESTRDHIVVRVHDGKIVAGSSHVTVKANSVKAAENSNPVSRPLFNPTCYRATDEHATTFEGRQAVEIAIAATCKDAGAGEHNYAFTTLYADAHTMQPIDVSGTVPETNENKMVSVALDQRFANFGGHVLPSSIKVDVSGSGLMFWLQVHVTETYTNYQFLDSFGG